MSPMRSQPWPAAPPQPDIGGDHQDDHGNDPEHGATLNRSGPKDEFSYLRSVRTDGCASRAKHVSRLRARDTSAVMRAGAGPTCLRSGLGPC